MTTIPPPTVTKTASTVSVVHNAPIDGAVLDSTTVKSVAPGWRTSEFWGALATSVLGALMTSGLWADGSTAMRVAGAAMVVLASMGYSLSRGITKGAAS